MAALLVVATISLIAGVLWWRAAPSEALPPAFAGRTNPRAHDPAALAEGGVLFESNCTSCHGSQADGHGIAANGLVPPPANFRSSDVLPRHSDAYLFYRITDGKPGTAMPSFRGALSEEERWAVVAFLRSLR
jgi:mono/diheme cytochrome c family protein